MFFILVIARCCAGVLGGVSSATVGGAFLRGLGLFGGLAFVASFERGVVAEALVPEEVLLLLVQDADGGGEVVVS